MDRIGRGPALTILAVLFAILALTDLLKPFHLEGPTTGLVFLGTRLKGLPNAILGPAMGIFLLIYAAGIWQMRGYALVLGIAYAIYIVVNLVAFSVKHSGEDNGGLAFAIAYTLLAIAFSSGTAFLLWRRRADLA